MELPDAEPVGAANTVHSVQHALSRGVRSAGLGLPTEGRSVWNALYFVLMLEMFFTAATMSNGVLEVLVPEPTKTAQDLTSVVRLIFLFAVTGAGLGLVMGGFIKDAYGIQVAGTFFALVALVFRHLSRRAVWNRAPRDTAPAQVPFWRGFKDPLRNTQFVAFLSTFVMFTTGVGLLQGWVPFFAVGVLMQDRDGAASSFLSMSVIAGVVAAGPSSSGGRLRRAGLPNSGYTGCA